MSDARLTLSDRLANLSFRTKLFAVAVVYMIIAFWASEATGSDLPLRFWFASALPIVWLVGLFLQWLSLRPRLSLGAAIGDLVDRARARPLVAGFYGIAAVLIETFVMAEALGRPLFH